MVGGSSIYKLDTCVAHERNSWIYEHVRESSIYILHTCVTRKSIHSWIYERAGGSSIYKLNLGMVAGF